MESEGRVVVPLEKKEEKEEEFEEDKKLKIQLVLEKKKTYEVNKQRKRTK